MFGPNILPLLLACLALPRPAAPSDVDAYNVVWNSPSADASGSMPIGNGEVGLNVWVEPGGDLLFYLSRVDAWSECERLLKLGRVRIALTPNPFAAGSPFRQELRLREGRIALGGGAGANAVELSVWVSANAPVVFVECTASMPVRITATLENWRTERRTLTDPVERQSSWTMRDAPPEIVQREVWEAADAFAADPRAVIWYHRNEHSIVPFTLAHQGLTEIADPANGAPANGAPANGALANAAPANGAPANGAPKTADPFPDPLLNRTFGGRMESAELGRRGSDTLTGENVQRAVIRIVTHSVQTPTVAAWLEQVQALATASANTDEQRSATRRWWRDFWERSWVFVEGDEAAATTGPQTQSVDPAPPAGVTRAYVLQRWIAAGASRGRFPPKFNGSIFTVEPKFTEGQPFNADWRKWGGCYWWQNTRLPYYPMLAAGDWDLMAPLFGFYGSALKGCQARARLYYKAGGVYFPETMTTFATYANGDYGWQREGVDRSVVQSPWWQYAWQQGLELTQLMLDYAAYTGDEQFLKERALPMAREVLRYYDTRFQRAADGKLLITPTQAVETYWHDVVNDMPSVAGLHAVCDALRALPEKVGTAEDRALWRRMKDAAPPLPMRSLNGKTALAPAEKYRDERSNCETPELYSVFPFRLTCSGQPELAAARAAYRARTDKSHVGWTQDGLFAALLGLTEEAQADLLAKTRNSHPHFRFPAMWGPNFDWLPDQDHGSNLMNLLQLMLLQCDGRTIRLLPAWPKDWNVRFKLHAPFQTTVECEYRAGALVSLKVTPEARRADVVLPQNN